MKIKQIQIRTLEILLKISPRELTGECNIGLNGDIGLNGECKLIFWTSFHLRPRESTDECSWFNVGLNGDIGLNGECKLVFRSSFHLRPRE